MIKYKKVDLNEVQILDDTKTYEQGLADAWECARKIILSYKGYSALKPLDFKGVFGTSDISEILENLTVAEAIAKIKEYEEKQQEIKIGDEVYFLSECKGVLICKDNNSFTILWDDGNVIMYDKQSNRHLKLKKTGRYFPQVEEMLKAIRGRKVKL